MSPILASELFDLIFPVLAVHPDATKIILPPPPRYLFMGGCANTSHAENIRSPGHAQEMLEKIIHLRSQPKKHVIASSLKH